MRKNNTRFDHQIICELITKYSSVLDLGCGTGELLFLLNKKKKVNGQGIDINEQAIYQCIAKGLSVFHGDIELGLSEYKDKFFDYVILNKSLQEIRSVEMILDNALRVGKKVIVGIPNFAYYKARLRLFFLGKVPVTSSHWYETPNLRFLSLLDFHDYCQKKKIKIERSIYLTDKKQIFLFPNILANNGIFIISR